MALEERTRARDPAGWAETQINLGCALDDPNNESDELSRLVAAVAAFRSALAEYPPERTPMRYAMAQLNLAHTLQRLGGRGETSRFEEALAAYREGQYRPELAPRYYLRAAIDYSRLTNELRRWEETTNLLEPLLDVVIPLVKAEPISARQQLLLEGIGRVGDALAYAWIQRSNAIAALRAVERGRAIICSAALDLDTSQNRPEVLAARRAWHVAQQAADRTELPATGDNPEGIAEKALLRTKHLEEVRATFSRYLATITAAENGHVEPPDVEMLFAALPMGGALVVPIVTEIGGAVLILCESAPVLHVLHLPKLLEI